MELYSLKSTLNLNAKVPSFPSAPDQKNKPFRIPLNCSVETDGATLKNEQQCNHQAVDSVYGI